MNSIAKIEDYDLENITKQNEIITNKNITVGLLLLACPQRNRNDKLGYFVMKSQNAKTIFEQRFSHN